MTQVHPYFSNGRVTVLSGKLLISEKFNRLIESETVADALKILYDAQYGKSAAVENPNDFDIILEKELLDAVALFKELCGDKNVVNFFLAKYDYLNAKTLFKNKANGFEGVGNCFAGTNIPPLTLQDAINGKEYKILGKFMSEACQKIDEKFTDGSITPRFIDVTLDKAMFKEMNFCAKASKLKLLRKLLSFEIDCLNVLMLFRSKKTNQSPENFQELYLSDGLLSKEFLVRYYERTTAEFLHALPPSSDVKSFAVLAKQAFETGNLLEAETAIAKGKIEIVSQKKNIQNIQPVVEYFLSRTTEIDKVRFILICIKNGISKDSIKGRLKQLYA